jgi:hypothetical protein
MRVSKRVPVCLGSDVILWSIRHERVAWPGTRRVHTYRRGGIQQRCDLADEDRRTQDAAAAVGIPNVRSE